METLRRGEQAQDKKNYDGRIQLEPDFVINQWVLIDRAPLSADAPTNDSIATSTYKKQQPKTTGPHKIKRVQQNTFLIDEGGVCNALSFHSVIRTASRTPVDGKVIVDASTK